LTEPDTPILIDAYGKRMKRGGLSYLILKLAGRAGIKRIPVRPHIVRHTVNTVRRASGIDSLTRSRLLTHTSPASLASYEHGTPEELVAARASQRAALEEIIRRGASSGVIINTAQWRSLPAPGGKLPS
jgi:site-specific recombinase XerD